MVSAKWHEPEILLRDSRIRAASGQKRKSSVGFGMSAFGGKADIDFGRLDVCL